MHCFFINSTNLFLKHNILQFIIIKFYGLLLFFLIKENGILKTCSKHPYITSDNIIYPFIIAISYTDKERKQGILFFVEYRKITLMFFHRSYQHFFWQFQKVPFEFSIKYSWKFN